MLSCGLKLPVGSDPFMLWNTCFNRECRRNVANDSAPLSTNETSERLADENIRRMLKGPLSVQRLAAICFH